MEKAGCGPTIGCKWFDYSQTAPTDPSTGPTDPSTDPSTGPIANPAYDATNDQSDMTGAFFSKNFCHPDIKNSKDADFAQ